MNDEAKIKELRKERDALYEAGIFEAKLWGVSKLMVALLTFMEENNTNSLTAIEMHIIAEALSAKMEVENGSQKNVQ